MGRKKTFMGRSPNVGPVYELSIGRGISATTPVINKSAAIMAAPLHSEAIVCIIYHLCFVFLWPRVSAFEVALISEEKALTLESPTMSSKQGIWSRTRWSVISFSVLLQIYLSSGLLSLFHILYLWRYKSRWLIKTFGCFRWKGKAIEATQSWQERVRRGIDSSHT